MDAEALAALLFLGFEHGSNKIHHWGIPPRPLACPACTSTADTLQKDPGVQRQFLHMVLLSMFTAAGSYSSNHRYFDEFERRWDGCCPEQVLTAARASIYSSGLREVQDWCTECYPALAHYLWKPPAIGKLWSVIQPSHIICGSLPPSASCAVVPMHWTHLTSQALSQKSCPQSRATPRQLCLGKHLRASKLRLQAKHTLRHRRFRRRTLTWKQQVAARLCATLDGWSTWLALCAHRLAYRCCVLPLPRVTLFGRFDPPGCAHAQATRGPTGLNHTQELPWGRTAIQPFRVKSRDIACHACLHSLTLRLGLVLSCRTLTLPLLCSATMDPLRDPLHDSALDEALADPGPADTTAAAAMAETTGASDGEDAAASDGDSHAGSVFSTLTAALEADEAAEPVPIDPHAPPAGPPAPMPLWIYHDDPARPPTPFSTLPPMPSGSSPRPARTIGPMPGEHSVDGPAWHRSLVQNVLQHLGCSAPAFLTAPATLAEVHSWNALRISISEAGPADYLQGLPVEIQDADSALFRAAGHTEDEPHPAAGLGSMAGMETGEEEDSAAAEDDATEEEHPVHDPTWDPPSHREGLYECDGVRFDLTAAEACLEATKAELRRRRAAARGAMGSGEPASGSRRPSSPTISPPRSSSSPGTASRSRSRRRRRPPPADRWGGWKTKQGCKHVQLPLADTVSSRPRRCLAAHTCSGEPAPSLLEALILLGRSVLSPCSKHRPRRWSPVLARPACSADRPLAGVGPETLPSLCAENVRLSLQLSALLSTLWRCVGCAALAFSLLLSVLACMHQHLCPPYRYRCPACSAPRVPVAREAWSVCLWRSLWSTPCLAHRHSWDVSPCLQALDTALLAFSLSVASFSPRLHPGPATDSASPFATTKSRPGPNSRGLSTRRMQHLIILLCLHQACAGSQAEARVAAHATGTAGGTCLNAHCLPASMPKPGGFPASVNTRQPLNVPNTRSAKRAFQRACNRATRYGHTQYRGRTLTSAQVPPDRRQATPQLRFTRVRKHASPEGLTVFSWNAGGLGGGVYDEVMTHLSASNT